MKQNFRLFGKWPVGLLAITLVLLNFLFVGQATGVVSNGVSLANNPEAQLTAFTAYVNETYVYGYVDTLDIPITLRLKTGTTLKSEVSTVANDLYFSAYFSVPILAGDTIEVDLPSTATISIAVAPLSMTLNKENDTITGTATPDTNVAAMAFSFYYWQWYYTYPTVDGSGNFTADFAPQVDVMLGDGAELWYTNPQNYRTVLRNTRAHGLHVNPFYDYVTGYGRPGVPVTLTLKDINGNVKDTAAPIPDNNGYFYAYFYNPALVNIVSGDSVEMQFPGFTMQTVLVSDVAVTSINAGTNEVAGIAPANGEVIVEVWDSYMAAGDSKIVYANGAGQFSANFNVLNVAADRQANRRPPVGPAASNSFIAAALSLTTPLEKLEWLVRVGAIERSMAGAMLQPGEGEQMVRDPAAVDALFQNYWQQLDPDGTTLSLAPGSAALGGTGLEAADDGRRPPAPTLQPDLSEGPTTPTAFDILPGSYGYAVYHNSQDNEISGNTLFAGPFSRVYLASYYDVYTIGTPGQGIEATLRNSLGAMKGSANGVASSSGGVSLRFLDTAGLDVNAVPGDKVEVTFDGGPTHLIDVVAIDFVIDRDMKTVYGTGPANSTIRLVYREYTADVATDANGFFSHIFNTMSVGYSVQIYYRNLQGQDLYLSGSVPQFTVNPDSNSLYGYGPANEAVVGHVLDSNSNLKGTASANSSSSGYYYLYFGVDIVVGDTIAIDVGPLHYEQDVVALTIAADTVNNVVYGTAPPSAWLNVFDQNSFGPYSLYNYQYFRADGSGAYSAAFSEVQSGDYLRVLYWAEGAQKDRVEIYRYAPYLHIFHTLNVVSGSSTPGASGNITIRNSNGDIKASTTVNASVPYGFFSYQPTGVDIVPGDSVQIDVGALDYTTPVIQQYATVDAVTEVVSGSSLPNSDIGLIVTYWDEYWGVYRSHSSFVSTNGSGDFSEDYSGVADLGAGDYVTLYYMDNQATRYSAQFFTSQPTVTVDSYPTAVQPYNYVNVEATLANGYHPQSIYVRWDTESHADDNGYSYFSSWQQATLGQNLLSFLAPGGGMIYFKVYAFIDGQGVWSDEHSIDVDETTATTLYDPVSGTTNDSTPQLKGVAAPNASVALYLNGSQIMTTTVGDTGYFTFNISTPLSAGPHDFHAIATVDGVTGPSSNIVHLTVDPALLVDPVHILLTARGQTQHLRDSNGYANLGGTVWTRTGDSVFISIPISYTEVYSADLYVGGVLETSLLDSGDHHYIGTYTTPTSGTYAVALKFRGGDAGGPVYTINILTGLIDPDGYVYDVEKGPEYRLAGAQVICYELVEGVWQTWNAAVWGQINPQIVASDGYYAFFTLPGQYKVVVTAPGYLPYESPVLIVEDEPVHHNVPLQRIYYYTYLPIVNR